MRVRRSQHPCVHSDAARARMHLPNGRFAAPNPPNGRCRGVRAASITRLREAVGGGFSMSKVSVFVHDAPTPGKSRAEVRQALPKGG